MLDSKVNIYKVLEPGDLFKFEKILPRLLFDLPKNENDYVFSISPISGWIYFSNYKEVRLNKSIQHLPKNDSEVKQAVSAYLSSVKEKLSKERRRNSKFNINQIFPDKIVSQQISPVFNSETGLIDHWIASFQPFLRGGIGFNSGYFPVIGASLIFRIGNYGRVIGLSSNWRIIGNSLSELLLPPPVSLNEQHHGDHDALDTEHNNEHANGHDEEHSSDQDEHDFETQNLLDDDGHKKKEMHDGLTLCYYDKGEYIYQNFLCPYYFQSEGHHITFEPSTKVSIVVNIIEDHHDNQIDLYGVVKGGSGDFQFEWSTWKIEDIDNSYTEYAREQKITTEVGSYTVLLTVTDLRTSVKEQMSQLVYGHIKESSTSEPQLIV